MSLVLPAAGELPPLHELGEAGFVMSRGDGRVFALNPTARLLWSTLSAGGSAEDAAESVAARFGLSATAGREHLATALAAWRDAGLLDPAPPPAARVPERRDARTPCRLDVGLDAGERPVRLRCDDPALAETLHALTAPLHDARAAAEVGVDALASPEGIEIVVAGRVEAVFAHRAQARSWLVGRIALLAHPERRIDAILHAAALELDGSAVLIAGESGAGKSTLAAAMIAQGAALACDDQVPLDAAQGLLWPLPMAMAIKTRGREVAGRFIADLDRHQIIDRDGQKLAYVPAARRSDPAAALPVRLVVFPDRHADGPAEDVSREAALAALLAHGSGIARTEDSLARLVAWAHGLSAVRLPCADLLPAIATLRRLAAAT